MKVWSSESADLSCMIRDLIWAGLISYDGFDSRLHDMPASSLVWHVFDVFFAPERYAPMWRSKSQITLLTVYLCYCLIWCKSRFHSSIQHGSNCSASVGYLTSWHGCRMVSMSLIPFWGPPNVPAFPGSRSPCVVCLSTKSWWCGIFQHACMFF